MKDQRRPSLLLWLAFIVAVTLFLRALHGAYPAELPALLKLFGLR